MGWVECPAMRKVRYRLYVDESGDHVFKESQDKRHRYLTLLGLWFEQGEPYLRFAELLQRLKDSVFGQRPDDPVILHRSKIVQRKGPFGILNDPALREKLENGLCWIAERADYTVVGVTIDKVAHHYRYSNPLHPYHYCLAALLERYAYFLNNVGARGDVVAEARGRREDTSLKQAYLTVYESGTQTTGGEIFQRALTTRELKCRRKERNIPGLQLADLLAHPLSLDMVADREVEALAEQGASRQEQEQARLARLPPGKLNTRLIDAARSKIRSRPWSGDHKGFGKKWL